MRISQIATHSGVPAKTIRYYESIGLIPAASRTENGYRQYRQQDLQTLRFVQRSRALGFTVEDVGDLLALWHDKERASADVRRLAKRHIDAIAQKIASLEAMRSTLTDLVERCHGDDRPDCPILDDLSVEKMS